MAVSRLAPVDQVHATLIVRIVRRAVTVLDEVDLGWIVGVGESDELQQTVSECFVWQVEGRDIRLRGRRKWRVGCRRQSRVAYRRGKQERRALPR